MTAIVVNAAALACVLGGYTIARRTPAAAALWTLPPLPVLQHKGATAGWSPIVEQAAAPCDPDALMPQMTTGELVAFLAADHADVAATLDTIEANLSAELDWVVASALLWLGGDLESEHALVCLADYADTCPVLIGGATACAEGC
jgi:hypothetical protein